MTIPRGNTKNIKIKVTMSDGTPVSLLGFTMLLTIKRKPADDYEDALVKLAVTDHTNALAGETEFNLTRDDTMLPLGTYRIYFTMTDADGNTVTYRDEELKISGSEA